MVWSMIICAILPTIIFTSSAFQESAAIIYQETLLMPFEDRVKESVGFGRYFVRKSQAEVPLTPEDDNETPMKRALGSKPINVNETNYPGRHHRPSKWFYKLQDSHLKRKETKHKRSRDWKNWQSQSWKNAPFNWQSQAPNEQNKHEEWHHAFSMSRFNENKQNIRKKMMRTEDMKPDNISLCYGCGPDIVSDNIASTNEHREEEEPLSNNFMFHKVNVETSYDPFTKRPYHRTIIAMTAIPDNMRKKGSEEKTNQHTRHTLLPRYDYKLFSNISANQNIERNERPIEDEFLFSSKKTNNPLRNQQKEPNKNQSFTKNQYKYPPPDGAQEQAADYDSDEARFRITNMDSLWISSYLENPPKFDSIAKQLRFLKQWLARLDRHHRRKVERYKLT